jgi:complex iron-sulfur molybdoenzyme family reductase subunit gamma
LKRIICIILTITLILGTTLNGDKLIKAKEVEHLGEIKPASSAWLSAKPTKILLYPSIKIVNKESQKKLNGTKLATVQVLYDREDISFLITWRDDTKDVKQKDHNISDIDKFAIQFVKTVEIKKLPFIEFGNKGRSVISYSQEAYATNKTEPPKISISEGFDDTKEIKEQNITLKLNMEYANNGWKGTLTRPLIDKYLDLNRSSIPVSFAIWDKNIKLISGWVGVSLSSQKNDPLLNRLSKKAKGNIKKGEKLYISNCIKCHKTDENQSIAQKIAPDLSNIGGYSNIDYLIESIVKPNAIIVSKNFNLDNNNSNWYKIDNNNTKISTMPSFEYLDKASIIDIVTYLQTLKAKADK